MLWVTRGVGCGILILASCFGTTVLMALVRAIPGQSNFCIILFSQLVVDTLMQLWSASCLIFSELFIRYTFLHVIGRNLFELLMFSQQFHYVAVALHRLANLGSSANRKKATAILSLVTWLIALVRQLAAFSLGHFNDIKFNSDHLATRLFSMVPLLLVIMFTLPAYVVIYYRIYKLKQKFGDSQPTSSTTGAAANMELRILKTSAINFFTQLAVTAAIAFNQKHYSMASRTIMFLVLGFNCSVGCLLTLKWLLFVREKWLSLIARIGQEIWKTFGRSTIAKTTVSEICLQAASHIVSSAKDGGSRKY